MNDTLATIQHCVVRPGRPLHRQTTLRGMIATWRERARFRWDLKRMAETNPHLIDDIGLTNRQVEEEIAKLPLWQR
ncbi:DUF1127 domain-containing protein [Mesorhizobium sp. M4B.F.Ca.ET.019.03.1.1]|uniref:DUF1127 domain-containing protein n=1 Tax=Mesorhizobium sp. M4B.F.Ca.ET.019.03.1.1 TaxID=2496651 RepID=UPI000FCBFA83|nr:DUF1127 domain-containing protein [Mesorhizobium sp. M4B.F.Ca.ET.019.03.1.1]RVD39414.1 DUF1127 domain-containing protein [Mesorhizobium sp. M4B.F.Ca.ET.019.03.1.1]